MTTGDATTGHTATGHERAAARGAGRPRPTTRQRRLTRLSWEWPVTFPAPALRR
jgi:hypothetical protein